MKKLKNKQHQVRISRKRFLDNLKRKDKPYILEYGIKSISSENKNPYQDNVSTKEKRLYPPLVFSFIMNTNKSLEFFDDLFNSIENNYLSFYIDMKGVTKLTIEVLLYLISLDKLFKHNNKTVSIKIRVPDDEKLRYLIAQSGFGNYFKADMVVKLNHKDIFSIKDGETNKKNNYDDAYTCKDAIDFSLKFNPGFTFKNTKFQKLYNALAEMMTNTDNHAYSKNIEFRNWYLFSVRVEKGTAFYFFDNGKGILTTAKKSLLETVTTEVAGFSFSYESVMNAVLNGDYRSATGLPYRNKGLPEIKDFLIESFVSSPIILSNKAFYTLDSNNFIKTDFNFRGTLFVWILKDEEIK